MIKRILGALKHKNLNETHDYWKKPNDAFNSEAGYLDNEDTFQRTEFLHKIIEKYFQKDAKILELGCNVGRNLNYLFKNGYHNLSGVEINEAALTLMKKHYSEMASNSDIKLGEIEKVIPVLREQEFDLIYSMAVFEHVHSDSEWIFEMIPHKTKFILTIEDERSISWRHFPRRYDKVFKKLEMLEAQKCDHIRAFNNGFYMRLFQCKN